MSAVLAVDLGGSALKACLYHIGGEAIAAATMPLAFDEDAEGRSEQHPEFWWDALKGATEEIAAKSPSQFKDVEAIAICGFTRTQVFIDEHNDVVRPAIGFRDSRAADAGERASATTCVAGHPGAHRLNAFHPLARLLWLRENEPEAWTATRFVIEPKDYLNLRLTGKAKSDGISQYVLGIAMRGKAPSLSTAVGIKRDILADLLNAGNEVGHVQEGLPGALSHLAGARVLCGSNDTWAAVAGLGALRAGHAYCISGSSEVLGLMSDRDAAADGLSTVPWGRNIWQIGGPGQNGANVLGWIVDCLDGRDLPFAERLGALLERPASGQPLIFHPFLHGERVPFWDRDLRASFIGLGAGHGAGDMVRAVKEGVAFVNRVVLERAEHAAGRQAPEIRIAGGGARSSVWNQIRADILGRPVLAAPDREMGLTGCLALARVGLGIDDNIGVAADAVSTDFTCFEPDPLQRPRLDALYSVFKDTHAAIADASHRLARIGREELNLQTAENAQ